MEKIGGNLYKFETGNYGYRLVELMKKRKNQQFDYEEILNEITDYAKKYFDSQIWDMPDKAIEKSAFVNKSKWKKTIEKVLDFYAYTLFYEERKN